MDIRINLLPEEKKQEIRSNQRFYAVLWQGISLLLLLALYGGVLGGLYATLSFQLENSEKIESNGGKEGSIAEVGHYENIFREANDQIEVTRRFQQEHIRWSRVFMALDAIVPESVTLGKVSSKDYQFSLSGKAQTREALLEFQAKMNQSDCFQNANVPLSDLFSQKNIEFQMDAEVKSSCLKPSKS